MTIESTIVDLLKESQNLQEAIAADPSNARNNVQTQKEGGGGTSKKSNRVTQGALPAETMRKLQAEAYDELDEDEIDLIESIDDETFDQLDELSKATLGSYVKAASKDAQTAARFQHSSKADQEHGAEVRKKRNAGIAKAVERLTKEDVDLSEDVAALFNGAEGLTEEFRQKAETIFEAVVINRIQEEVARIEEAYKSALEEAINEEVEGLVEHIDGYLNLAVEQWMVENEVALESGMKTDILESFVGGMKQLFKEHYVEVPEEKLDLVSEMEQQIDELNAKLNESVALNVQMHKALNEGAKSEIIAEAVQGLTDVQAEKLQMIAEELAFEDVDSFAQKVQVIRENYFAKKPARAAVASPAFLNEETTQEEKEVPAAMRAYVNTISTLNR